MLVGSSGIPPSHPTVGATRDSCSWRIEQRPYGFRVGGVVAACGKDLRDGLDLRVRQFVHELVQAFLGRHAPDSTGMTGMAAARVSPRAVPAE